MIGSHDIGQDKGVINVFSETFIDKKVIDPPADIAYPGAAFHVPPAVLPGFGIEPPKGIDEAGIEKGRL